MTAPVGDLDTGGLIMLDGPQVPGEPALRWSSRAHSIDDIERGDRHIIPRVIRVNEPPNQIGGALRAGTFAEFGEDTSCSAAGTDACFAQQLTERANGIGVRDAVVMAECEVGLADDEI